MNWESRLVLVAEDSDDDYFLLTRAFRKANFHNPIHRVENGHEAILYLSGTAPYSDRSAFPLPYMVLLDLKMPLMHGFDVLDWIRHQKETLLLPVVMFSSSHQGVDIRTSYDKGANGYVTKPETATGLVEVVSAIHAYWVKTNRSED